MGEALAVGRASVVHRHLAGGPTKDCHELSLARAALGGTGRAGFAQAMRSAGTGGLAAGFPEPIAEALLDPRLARLIDAANQSR